MYWAKQRASAPVSIFWSATLHDGIGTFLRPASCTAFWISIGLISAEPTMSSRFNSVVTVLRASTPRAIEPTPKAIMTTPATSPPILRILCMSMVLSACGGVRRDRVG